MPSSPHRSRVGAHPGDPFPSFAADPAAWLAHVDRLLETDPRGVLAAPPETWIDPIGHIWRVVATAEGPEIRPGLQRPFLRRGGLPQISALLVTPETLRVELTMHEWREVVDVTPRRVAVRDLGLAMLTGIELPHEGLHRIGEDVWHAAAERWSRLRAERVAIEVHDTLPTA